MSCLCLQCMSWWGRHPASAFRFTSFSRTDEVQNSRGFLQHPWQWTPATSIKRDFLAHFGSLQRNHGFKQVNYSVRMGSFPSLELPQTIDHKFLHSCCIYADIEMCWCSRRPVINYWSFKIIEIHNLYGFDSIWIIERFRVSFRWILPDFVNAVVYWCHNDKSASVLSDCASQSFYSLVGGQIYRAARSRFHIGVPNKRQYSCFTMNLIFYPLERICAKERTGELSELPEQQPSTTTLATEAESRMCLSGILTTHFSRLCFAGCFSSGELVCVQQAASLPHTAQPCFVPVPFKANTHPHTHPYTGQPAATSDPGVKSLNAGYDLN